MIQRDIPDNIEHVYDFEVSHETILGITDRGENSR